MEILIVAVGSPGDVAPCAVLGQALAAVGHRVTLAAYESFARPVRDCGLQLRALPGDPRLLGAASWERRSTGLLRSARLLRLVAAHLRDVHAGILSAALDGAQVLLLQGISAFGGYHIAEALGLASMGLALSPIYPTSQLPPATTTAHSLGRLGKRAAGMALVLAGSPALAWPVKELRAELGLPRLGSYQAIFGRHDAACWPIFYGLSAAFVPRATDWRRGLLVTGYWWPPRTADWQPPGRLQDFLAAGPPPVFAGFGSMRAADPGEISDLRSRARGPVTCPELLPQRYPDLERCEPVLRG
jgi:sterol 3beta-glucosyltransferase